MDIVSIVDLIARKAEKYQLEHITPEKLRSEMANYRVCIAVVGAFNAGKSSLLNALMGGDFLAEGQRPTTAIASEISYDEEDYVEAISGNSIARISVNQARALDTTQYDYLKWHMNNNGLRQIREYVLVDMPGFDSGIQAHNQAILRYVDRASAYLLVIDVEDGGIKQSLHDFVREIRSYENNLAILLNKCELKTETDIQEIRADVQRTAQGLFGENIPVDTVSARNPESAGIMVNLIRGFDREKIFYQRFRPMVLSMGQEAVHVLRVLLHNQRLNTEDLNLAIEERERARRKIAQQLEREKNQVADRMEEQTLATVMEDIREALTAQTFSLASSIQAGGANFSEKVNAILRPVLVSSLKRSVEDNFDSVLADLRVPAETGADDMPTLDGLMDGVQKGKELTAMMVQNADQYGGLYKTITGVLAVTTSFIAPWLEVLTFFLPDILKFFFGLGQRSQREELESRVRAEVIPEIVEKLKPKVAESIRDIEAKMFEELQAQADRNMDAEEDALKRLREQMEERTQEYTRNAQEIQADIDELCVALESL